MADLPSFGAAYPQTPAHHLIEAYLDIHFYTFWNDALKLAFCNVQARTFPQFENSYVLLGAGCSRVYPIPFTRPLHLPVITGLVPFSLSSFSMAAA